MSRRNKTQVRVRTSSRSSYTVSDAHHIMKTNKPSKTQKLSISADEGSRLAYYAEREIEGWYDDYLREHCEEPTLAQYHRAVARAYRSAREFVNQLRLAA